MMKLLDITENTVIPPIYPFEPYNVAANFVENPLVFDL